MDNGFYVAVSRVLMPERDQIAAQFLVVINFAVAHYPDGAIFVGDGLMASLKVNDAKPTHGEANISCDVESIVVRTTMRELAVHFRQLLTRHVASPIELENAANAAHSSSLVSLTIGVTSMIDLETFFKFCGQP